LANRIRRIEEFLMAGNFLFTSGRAENTKEYHWNELQGIPGESKYDETSNANDYISFPSST